MPDTLPTSKPRGKGLAKGVTVLLESVGVLNKGSADAPATPSVEQATSTAGINTNALNVTRVAGLASAIAAVGAAALALFNVDKATDAAPVVVAAYLSVGAIVASALLASAIIVSADIRSRLAANTAAVQSVSAAPDDAVFRDTWRGAIADLKSIVSRLEHGTAGVYDTWLDASANTGPIAQLDPPQPQHGLHARLKAGQSRIVSKLEGLINESDAQKKQAAIAEIQNLIDSMARSLQ